MLHKQVMYRDVSREKWRKNLVGRLRVEVTIAEEEYPAYVL